MCNTMIMETKKKADKGRLKDVVDFIYFFSCLLTQKYESKKETRERCKRGSRAVGQEERVGIGSGADWERVGSGSGE